MRQLLLILLLSISLGSAIGQAGIGITVPHTSAMLDVTSTNKGFLPPRMTTAERNAIAAPAAGLTIYNTTVNCLQWYNGTGWYDACGNFTCGNSVTFMYNGSSVTYGTVMSSGKCWLDRNLGATRVATSSTDAASYGDLFQWGRGADGHQVRSPLSGTISTLSGTDSPGHGNFILATSTPFDWRSPQNDNLWQGVSGVNNPCPSGYRLPTETELNNERLSWGFNQNAVGAFASPLKLPVTGGRSGGDGSLSSVGTSGNYWSSTVSFTDAGLLGFGSSLALMFIVNRASGLSVRCLKD